jgi:hypothetical protein
MAARGSLDPVKNKSQSSSESGQLWGFPGNEHEYDHMIDVVWKARLIYEVINTSGAKNAVRFCLYAACI